MSDLVTIYTSAAVQRRPLGQLLTIVREMALYRHLVVTLFCRDLKAQYRMSILGYLWLIFPPMITTMIWFFLHSQRIVRVETEIPYPLFVLIGTTIWVSFAGFIPRPFATFEGSKAVFTRIKVPPEVFVLSGLLQAGFEMLIRLLFLVPVFILFSYVPHSNSALAILPLFALVSLGMAIGISLIPLASLFGDTMSAVTSVLGLAMYASPVVYPNPGNDSIIGKIISLNPISPCIEGFRDCLTNGELDWLPGCIWVLVASWCLILVSMIVLRVAMPHIVSRIGMS